MSTFVPVYTIDFTGQANQNPLSDGGNWTVLTGAATLQILSGEATLTPSNSSPYGNVLSGPTLDADQYFDITIGNIAASASARVLGRLRGAAGGQGNSLTVEGNGAWNLRGIGNNIILSGTATVAAGDVWRLTAVGSTFEVFQNGVSQGSVSESQTISSTNQVLEIVDTSGTPSTSDAGVAKYVAGNVVSPHSISGNCDVGFATITYSGPSSGSVASDIAGNYSISNLNAGVYTLTPSATNYAFTPNIQSVTLANSNVTGINFTASLNAQSISIVQQDSAPFQGNGSDTFTLFLFVEASGLESVSRGHSLVAGFVLDTNTTIVSVMDNCGNDWEQVPGAYLHTGQSTDVDSWWTKDIAVAPALGNYELTVKISRSGGDLGAVVYDVVGINTASPTAATQIVNITDGSSVVGPSLDDTGNGGAYFTMVVSNNLEFSGTPSVGVSSPWGFPTTPGATNNAGSSRTNGGAMASLVSTGVQHGTFTPDPTTLQGGLCGLVFAAPNTFSITGNAGIANASVFYSGDALGFVVADGSGNYAINNLGPGEYLVTPISNGKSFIPENQSVSLTVQSAGDVSFFAFSPEIYSVPDCRDYGVFPNNSVDVQGTLTYVIPAHPSHPAPVDSRAAGAPVDSRAGGGPINSRTEPPF
jgi:hypothetical protein